MTSYSISGIQKAYELPCCSSFWSQIKRENAWNQHNVEDERVWRSCPHMALSAPWACRKTHRVYQDTSSTADTHIPELPQGVNKKMQIMQYIFFCKWEYVVHCGRWWMSGHFMVCLETCSRPSLSDIYKAITDGIYYKTQWLKVTHAIRKPKWMVLSTVLPFFFLFHCHLKLWFKQYKIKYI